MGRPCRVVMVTGAVSGLGKSTLSRRLADRLRNEGRSVEWFSEAEILERPEFSVVISEFRAGRVPTPALLLDAAGAYLDTCADSDAEVHVQDALFPYLPSLLAWGYDDDEIAHFFDSLHGRCDGRVELTQVHLEGDPGEALDRATAREGPGWLTQIAAKVNGFADHDDAVHTRDDLVRYFTRAAARSRRLLERAPWPVSFVDVDHGADHVDLAPWTEPPTAPSDPTAHTAAFLADVHAQLDADITPASLRSAYQSLTERYRAGNRTPRTLPPELVAAYAVARLPATLAANVEVLGQLHTARPGWEPRSMVDIGAGVGPAATVAAALWPTITDVTCIDDSSTLVEIGAGAARSSQLPAVRTARWIHSDAHRLEVDADLVVASYVLGEVTDPDAAADAWWNATRHTLVVIEPGTKAGFARIIASRAQLIDAGGSVIAPCPHDLPCPLPADDWCHFTTRVDRTRTHRETKLATRPTEDEPYSYVAVSRAPVEDRPSRILTPPTKRRGHVRLDLCTPAGDATEVVVAKSNPAYRAARALRWGDTTPLPTPGPHEARRGRPDVGREGR